MANKVKGQWKSKSPTSLAMIIIAKHANYFSFFVTRGIAKQLGFVDKTKDEVCL